LAFILNNQQKVTMIQTDKYKIKAIQRRNSQGYWLKGNWFLLIKGQAKNFF